MFLTHARIVDLGSLKQASQPLTKKYDDHENFITHIVAIRNRIARSKNLTHAERRFIPKVDELIERMAEGDPGTALREPSATKYSFLSEGWCASFFTTGAARSMRRETLFQHKLRGLSWTTTLWRTSCRGRYWS